MKYYMEMANSSLIHLAFVLFILLNCRNGEREKQHHPEQHKPSSSIRSNANADSLSIARAMQLAEMQFRKYLPKILKANNAYVDSQDTFTGDFTGDGIMDIAIYFSLAPNEGGNTIVAQGLVLYQNQGKKVKVIAGYEPNYLFSVKKIKNGKIYVEKLAYADTDAKCCPSLKTEHILTLSGNKVY